MPRVKRFDEQEVLTKAMDLFWKQGYAATSIQDLVNHLGINRASIYDTYGDKEQLFAKAFEYYRKTNTAGIENFFQGHPQVKEGFHKLFERAIEESLTDQDRKGCFVVNTTTELVPGDDKILGILSDNRERFERMFFGYLQQGETNGQIPKGKDLKALAALLFTYYSGLRVVSKVQSNKQELLASMHVFLSLLD